MRRVTYISIIHAFETTSIAVVAILLGLVVFQLEVSQSFPETLAVAKHQALQLFFRLVFLQLCIGHKFNIGAVLGSFLCWWCGLLNRLFLFPGGFRLF